MVVGKPAWCRSWPTQGGLEMISVWADSDPALIRSCIDQGSRLEVGRSRTSQARSECRGSRESVSEGHEAYQVGQERSISREKPGAWQVILACGVTGRIGSCWKSC